MTGPRAQYAPDLAAGPRGATLAEDVNLLVCVSADADETRIVFQRVDGAGAAIDHEPVVVAGGTDRYRDPVAAWNGELWLVVWEDRHGGTGNGGTLGRRVAPDGTLIDAAPFAILDGNDPDVGALATMGGGFLVAASQLTSGDIRTLWARRVGADGSLPDASKLGIGSNFAMAATVEGFDDRWMVAWYRRPTHDTPSSTLQARMVTAGGSVLPLLDPTNSTADELAPDLFIAGDVATLAWSDGTDIRVRQILEDGTGLGSPAGVVVSAAPEEQTAPTVTGDGAKLSVTWVDDRAHGVFEPGVGDLYAARLDAGLGVLEPLGIALAADGKAAEGEAGLVGHLGVTLVAYPAVLAESGGWRVLTGTLRDWDPMGHELPGASGPPRLWMSGLLVQGSTLSARLSDAAPSAPGLLILGGSAADLPFKGGVLVPQPTFLLPVATNALGEAHLSAPLATPLPSGVDLYVQAWLADAGGPAGLSATAAFHAVTP
jgi:hypothetical protein